MTMEHNFVLTRFMQRPLEYNKEVELTPEVLQDININFSLQLKFRKQTDLVGVQVDLMYAHQQYKILVYSILLTLQDFMWMDFMKNQPNEEQIREYASLWFDYAFDFMRGALAANANNTLVEKLFLPPIDINSCKEFIKIKEVVS